MADYKEIRDSLEKVRDGTGLEIDNGIKPLLAAVWSLGYKTRQSCEGHDNWGIGYPWIDFTRGQNMKPLEQLIEEYNKDHKIKWELVYSGKGEHNKTYSLKPVSKPLSTLKECREFGRIRIMGEVREDEESILVSGGYMPLKGKELQEAKKSVPELAGYISGKTSK